MAEQNKKPPPEKSKDLLTQTQDFSSSPARGEAEGGAVYKDKGICDA